MPGSKRGEWFDMSVLWRGDDKGGVMAEDYDLAAMIGSRICHDLISPLGAIGNGVELLQMDTVTDRPEIGLISDSVASATAKIKFLRVAFGTSSADHRFGRSELANIVADWSSGGRLAVRWLAPGDQPRIEVKLVFLGLQCLEAAMPRGGEITVGHDGRAWEIEAQARTIRPEPDLWRMLTDLSWKPPLAASLVQFAVLQDGLIRQRRRLSADFSETGAALRLM